MTPPGFIYMTRHNKTTLKWILPSNSASLAISIASLDYGYNLLEILLEDNCREVLNPLCQGDLLCTVNVVIILTSSSVAKLLNVENSSRGKRLLVQSRLGY